MKGSGESLRKTRIFPREKNPLPVLAPLSSQQAERNRARYAAEGFLRDSPLGPFPETPTLFWPLMIGQEG
jgi:hypothetical protein